jgi:hypothetical protein
MTPTARPHAAGAMMDDSKGRCQHEKIMEPCRSAIAPGGKPGAPFDEWMTFDWLSARKT